MTSARNATLYIDADCGLCRWCEGWLRRRDRFGRIDARPIDETDFDKRGGLVFIDAAGVWRASGAVLRVFRHLPGLWPLVWLLAAVPKPWRDAGYRLVARRRHRWCRCDVAGTTAAAEATQNIGG